MTEDDLKAVLAKYQQKTFELFNSNIVLETQVEKLNKENASLTKEIENLKKTRKPTKSTEDLD